MPYKFQVIFFGVLFITAIAVLLTLTALYPVDAAEQTLIMAVYGLTTVTLFSFYAFAAFLFGNFKKAKKNLWGTLRRALLFSLFFLGIFLLVRFHLFVWWIIAGLLISTLAVEAAFVPEQNRTKVIS